MGSIDENALQNLSLVINLTKHIHVKSGAASDAVDPDEYSNYFPSLMWVVRDFALQLCDQDGEPITSKEYLEKALHNQKGFSENIEFKNKIRRLLKSFFKERDCCTMIRPLTKEEDLQALESADLNDLRGDFVEQVLQLRRKVLNRVKPKTLNGKKLNGSMLAGLVENYVEAVNKGAVPNIENAWSYLCKNECQKALGESLEIFEEEFRSNFEMRMPLYDDELREVYKEAKTQALDFFNSKALGEVADEYLEDLEMKFDQKYSQYRAENENESRKSCQIFLQNCYQEIEEKLRKQQYESFIEFETDVKAFQAHFEDNGPPGPNRKSIMLEFCLRALVEGCDYFIRTIQNELSLKDQLNNEKISKLEQYQKELKSDLSSTKDKLESRVRELENERAHVEAKAQSFQDQLETLKKDKEAIEQEWRERLDTEKTECQKTVEEFKQKMYQTQNEAKDVERRVLQAESEFDKQRALKDQKIEHLESTVESLKQKDKCQSEELKSTKKELLASNKDKTSEFEGQIKELKEKHDLASEAQLEAEAQLQENEQKYEFDRKQWTD